MAAGKQLSVVKTSLVRDVERLGRVDSARGMRVVDVEPVFLSHTYDADHAPAWSGGSLPGITAGIVRVTTDDGLYGLGETYSGNFAPEVARALVEYFRPYVVGKDPADIGEIWSDLYSRVLYWGRTGIAVSVLSAIESALWDLCGKAVGKQVCELLGGKAHDRLPRYASGGMDSTNAQFVEEARGIMARGFPAMKIRIGVGPEEDREKVCQAKEVLGPGVELAVDAVQGSNPNPWPADVAIAAGKRIDRLGLLWYEEPCGSIDIDGYVACRRALDTPIAGGESCTTLHEFRRFLEAGALDVAQPDAAHVGGILEARKICALAEETGVDVAVHAWASGVCLMANYHVGFTAPNCTWLEYPTQLNPLINELLVSPLEIVDGHVLAPTAPGLGVDLTDDIIDRYPYKPDHRYYFEERRVQTERV
jgi:L-alanine-DL-glutamate epimerase-like enolase superfamily enzyme